MTATVANPDLRPMLLCPPPFLTVDRVVFSELEGALYHHELAYHDMPLDVVLAYGHSGMLAGRQFLTYFRRFREWLHKIIQGGYYHLGRALRAI